MLEADTYIPIHIKWDANHDLNSRILYWMVGDRNNSLLEVGLDAASGIIASITLVAIDAVTEIEESHLLNNPFQLEGLPAFTIADWPEDGYKVEMAEFKVFKIADRLLMLFSAEFPPSLKITSDRVSFGFDSENNLILIEIANLQSFEMEEILSSIRLSKE